VEGQDSRGRTIVKPFIPKRLSWAGLLASGFVIISGLILSLFVIVAFSDSPRRDTVLVLFVFGFIVCIPFWAMRTPKVRAARKQRGWWMFWRRRRRKKDLERRAWKRKKGQDHHQPFGTSDRAQPSTFVPTRRKPTGP
jgi:hypothetical protein